MTAAGGGMNEWLATGFIRPSPPGSSGLGCNQLAGLEGEQGPVPAVREGAAAAVSDRRLSRREVRWRAASSVSRNSSRCEGPASLVQLRLPARASVAEPRRARRHVFCTGRRSPVQLSRSRAAGEGRRRSAGDSPQTGHSPRQRRRGKDASAIGHRATLVTEHAL